MKFEGILFFVLLSNVKLAISFKCYLSGVPWPKECSLERFGANPACMTAEVYDEYNNPTIIRKCSKASAGETPGGCELMHKHWKVITCNLCYEDYCNNPENFNKARQVRPFSMVLLGLAAVIRLI